MNDVTPCEAEKKFMSDDDLEVREEFERTVESIDCGSGTNVISVDSVPSDAALALCLKGCES